MAIPDIQNLLDRLLIYGEPNSPPVPSRSEPRSQSPRSTYAVPADAVEADGGHLPEGGLFRRLNTPSTAVPWWVQALAPPGGIGIGQRRPMPPSRLGGLPFPLPSGIDNVVEIPDPHLERLIPGWLRDAGTVAALLTRIPGRRLLEEGEKNSFDSKPSHSDPNVKGPRWVPDFTIAPRDAEAGDHPLRLFLKGMYGDGAAGDDAYSRCVKAAEGGSDDWENFCKFLDRRQNNTVGGESQNRACWSKSFLPKSEKRNYCYNQFSKRQ